MLTKVANSSNYVNITTGEQLERINPNNPTNSAEKPMNLVKGTIQIKKTEGLPSMDALAMNNQKIEYIKQLLLEGKYEIDSKRIANKLIALELDLSK